MDIYSKLQAVATLLLAVGAIIVTFWTPNSFRWKLLIVFLFIVAAIVTLWLQEQKESRESLRREVVEKQQKDALDKLRQDIVGSGVPEVALSPPLDGSSGLLIHMVNLGPGNLYDVRLEIQEAVYPDDHGEVLLRKITGVQYFYIGTLLPKLSTDTHFKMEVSPNGGKYFIGMFDRSGQSLTQVVEIARMTEGMYAGRLAVASSKLLKDGKEFKPKLPE